MPLNGSFARRLRARRLHHHDHDRLLIVPLDHSISDGPVTGGSELDRLVGVLAGSGADAVVLHKGALRYIDDSWFRELSLILHLSASTAHAPDPDAKYLVAGVEEALRLGADAVSVHVNMGSAQEARQIMDLAAVAESCDRWNVPLLAMMYARGPRIAKPDDPELVAHTATLAADLGADLVKTAYIEDAAAMRDVVRRCPIPLVVAGGAQRTADGLDTYANTVLGAGAAGFAVGRNVFQAADPGAVTRRLADLAHSYPFSEREVMASDPSHLPFAETTGNPA